MRNKLNTSLDSLRNILSNIQFAAKEVWSISPFMTLVSTVIYIAEGLLPILATFLIGLLIDSVVSSAAGSGSLTEPLLLLSLLALTNFALTQSYRWENYVSSWLSRHMVISLSDKTFKKIASLDHYHYETGEFNAKVNKISSNLNVIGRLPRQTLQLITSIVQLVGTALVLITLTPWIVLLLLLSVTPLVLTLIRFARDRWEVWQRIDEDMRLAHGIESTLKKVDTIGETKIFNATDYLRQQWNKFYSRNQLEQLQVEKSGTKSTTISSLFERIVRYAVNVWLVIRVITVRTFSIGDFEFYRRLINDFSNTSDLFARSFQDLNEATLFVSDLRGLIELESRISEPTDAVEVPTEDIPKIEFKNVSFSYPGSEKSALNGVSFTINPGEDIALVGENGAGKTTIIKLLMRFYDVTEGEILVNETNIKELSLADWYRHIGVLFQEFNKYAYFKAYRSIGIGNIDKIDDREAIEAASTMAGADKAINSLDKGHETILSKAFKSGTDLSGGEWQRIALARGFFRDANILILDEPTAAIDAKAEYEIFKRIDETQQDKTTIIVSHRFSTVRKADTIYVVEDGQISQHGSHKELMKEGGTYKTMFDLQAEGYK